MSRRSSSGSASIFDSGARAGAGGDATSMFARSQLAALFFDREESLAMASPPPSLESLAMAYPPPSPPCDADCYTEQYILQIGIPVGVIAFLAICCLCYGCCSTSPDGSCYDDCCSGRRPLNEQNQRRPRRPPRPKRCQQAARAAKKVRSGGASLVLRRAVHLRSDLS